MNKDVLLGVNIDHIATIRQARGTKFPDPVHAAAVAEHAGAAGITAHLREDRRHIQDRDIELLAQTVQTRLNFEMAVTDEMLTIAERIKPTFCCLVPEKREELTTEGGLDVASQLSKVTAAVKRMTDADIITSLFIDAEKVQIDAAKKTGAAFIEIHTGGYAEAETEEAMAAELIRITEAAAYADSIGLKVNAGHGLNYHNVKPIAAIPQMIELNIGHAIIARAAIDGLAKATRDMVQLLLDARQS